MEYSFIAAKDKGCDSIAMYDIRKLKRNCETGAENIVQRVRANLFPAQRPQLTIAPVRHEDHWQEGKIEVQPH